MLDGPTAEDYAPLLAVGAEYEIIGPGSWDANSEAYDRAQVADDGTVPDGVVAHLVDRGLLHGARVLDVGAGTGRYALRLAPHAAAVHLTDFSHGMLDRARAHADAAGLTGLEFTQADWVSADLDALGWRGAFDLVLAAMVRSRDGVEQVIAASRAWCVVSRTIRARDSIVEHLTRDVGTPPGYDPANDREYPRALVNYIWLRGFLPTVSYVDRATIRVAYSLDDAVEHYGRRFGGVAREHGRDLRATLSRVAGEDGRVVADREETTAVISWHV